MARDWINLGAEIRAARLRLGFKTLKEFAARVGVSKETVSNIENGRKEGYSPGVIAAVEDSLGWVQGSFMAAVEGKQPRPKPDPTFDRVRAAWPKLDERDRKMVADLVESRLRHT